MYIRPKKKRRKEKYKDKNKKTPKVKDQPYEKKNKTKSINFVSTQLREFVGRNFLIRFHSPVKVFI